MGNHSLDTTQRAELRAQAETIASSIVNNASFNCIATKLIVTCQAVVTSERSFLPCLDSILGDHPTSLCLLPRGGRSL